MRGTRWGGSTLRTRNSGEAVQAPGCNGALDDATPGRSAGETRGEATEGTETVGATFAMRWRDGMEGEGGGAAGTAASVEKNHSCKNGCFKGNFIQNSRKIPWKFIDLAGSYFSQLPRSLGFSFKQAKPCSIVGTCQCSRGVLCDRTGSCIDPGVNRCWQPMWSQRFTLNMFEEQYHHARALATI